MIKEWTKEVLNTSVEWFREKLSDGLVFIGHAIYEWSDVALIISVVLILVTIFGSKRAGKGIYWTLATYLIIQLLGSIL